MPHTPGGMHNPLPEFPYCPEQTDFLTFRGADGFCAVYLDLIEGFAVSGDEPEETLIQLTNNNIYTACESVPTLVSRFAAIKKLRYAPERAETEVTDHSAQTTRPTPAVANTAIWKNGPNPKL